MPNPRSRLGRPATQASPGQDARPKSQRRPGQGTAHACAAKLRHFPKDPSCISGDPGVDRRFTPGPAAICPEAGDPRKICPAGRGQHDQRAPESPSQVSTPPAGQTPAHSCLDGFNPSRPVRKSGSLESGPAPVSVDQVRRDHSDGWHPNLPLRPWSPKRESR